MKKKIFVGIIVVIALLIGLCTAHTRKDSVDVTEIDGKFRIRFLSRGNYLAPITPEGPFPTWTDASFFQTDGGGARNDKGDITFELGDKLESQYQKYREGILTIHEKEKEITFKGKLGREYKSATNHSGTYAMAIERPQTFRIEQFVHQDQMLDKYIKARGRFTDMQFISGPHIFEDRHVDFVAGTGKYRGPGSEYEVIGYIQRHYEKGKYEINVFSATPIATKASNPPQEPIR